MLEVVVKNTDEDIERYKLDQQYIPFICDDCGRKNMIYIKNIHPDGVYCDRCALNH